MAYSITSTLGANLASVYSAGADLPVALGTVVRGSNGRNYVFAKASADIATATAVILTEPAMTIAAGAGAWTTRAGALKTGEAGWVEANAV